MTDIVEIIFRQKGAREVSSSIKDIEKNSKSATSTVDFFKNALLTLGAGITAREVLQLSDAFKVTRARIKLVTESTEELNAVQQALFDISRETRSSFDSTAELYSRIARNADDLGLSQKQLLSTTTAINKAIQISGVESTAANAAIVQLGQGLASGELRGDELRSVLEQVPRLAQAIADGMGVSIAELRELGSEGELTAERVINAIEKSAPQLEQEFAQIPATFGSALTTLGNSFELIIGRTEELTGGVGGLTELILKLSDFIADPATFDAAVAIFTNWSRAISEVKGNIGEFSTELEALRSVAGAVLSFLGDAFTNLPGNIIDSIKIATIEIISLIEATKARFTAFIDQIQSLYSQFVDAITSFSVTDILSGNSSIGDEVGGIFSGLGGIGLDQGVSETLDEELAAIEALREATLISIFEEREARTEAHEAFVEQQEIERAQNQEIADQVINNDTAKFKSKQKLTKAQQKLQEKAAKAALKLAEKRAREEARIEAAKTRAIRQLQGSLADNSIALINSVAGESKEAAIASVIIEKGRALAANSIATAEASTLAYASQLIPGDPSSVARASAASAKAKLLGGVNAALIAATGISDIVNINRNSGGSSVGGGSSSRNFDSDFDNFDSSFNTSRSANDSFSFGSDAENSIVESSSEQANREITIIVEPGIRDQGSILDLIEELGEAIGDNVKVEGRVS